MLVFWARTSNEDEKDKSNILGYFAYHTEAQQAYLGPLNGVETIISTNLAHSSPSAPSSFLCFVFLVMIKMLDVPIGWSSF